MANPNSSETTLVSAPASASAEAKRKPAKYYTEPYAAEFTGLSTMGGGMPSLAGAHFMAPPPLKATKKKVVVKMVPSQPFVGADGAATSSASFVDAKLDTVQGMFAPLSPSTSPSSSCSVGGKQRAGKGKSAKELVEEMYGAGAMGMIGGSVLAYSMAKATKNAKVQ